MPIDLKVLQGVRPEQVIHLDIQMIRHLGTGVVNLDIFEGPSISFDYRAACQDFFHKNPQAYTAYELHCAIRGLPYLDEWQKFCEALEDMHEAGEVSVGLYEGDPYFYRLAEDAGEER